MRRVRSLTDAWTLGGLTIPNRVVLAPLAGIGNWFVRLQAKRYGAGLAFSEMVSSFAVHHGNEKTCTEMLRIEPAERAGGPVAIQLFGQDPEIMRSAAAYVAEHVPQVDVIATGGLATAITPFTELIDEVDDLLTLTGLRLLYERNAPGLP